MNNNPEGSTMLFCNPNAGFYEFAFYQSEWFEFYMKLGVNLMMWNYPGYGRTSGSPTIKKLLRHGEAIITFLREVKKAKIIGVHGESLGGCVATHLANKCKLNFLFADRTFSSLSSAAYYNFGKIAYWGYRLARGDDADSVQNYIESRCYKVISCDSKDLMINDLASLKTGVAWNLSLCKIPKTHILTVEEMKNFYNSLVRMKNLVMKLGNFNRENLNLNPTESYQKLSEDSELFEDERFRDAVLKIKVVLNSIEAGGNSLLNAVKGKNPEVSLVTWVLLLDIWGSSIFTARNSPVQAAADTIKVLLKELEQMKHINGLKTEIAVLISALECIRLHIEIRLDSSDTRSLCTSQEFKQELDYEKAGYLIPLSCGHGGPFSSQERFAYEQHLLKARFTSYN